MGLGPRHNILRAYRDFITPQTPKLPKRINVHVAWVWSPDVPQGPGDTSREVIHNSLNQGLISMMIRCIVEIEIEFDTSERTAHEGSVSSFAEQLEN